MRTAAALLTGASAAMAAALPDPVGPDRPLGWPVVIERSAATVTALGVLVGLVWWLVGPRVRSFVSEQNHAARTISSTMPDQLDKLADQLTAVTTRQLRQADELDHLRERVDQIDQRVTEYLADAAAELRMMRAARLVLSASHHPPTLEDHHAPS